MTALKYVLIAWLLLPFAIFGWAFAGLLAAERHQRNLVARYRFRPEDVDEFVKACEVAYFDAEFEAIARAESRRNHPCNPNREGNQ